MAEISVSFSSYFRVTAFKTIGSISFGTEFFLLLFITAVQANAEIIQTGLNHNKLFSDLRRFVIVIN
jgi:hypothetical protein